MKLEPGQTIYERTTGSLYAIKEVTSRCIEGETVADDVDTIDVDCEDVNGADVTLTEHDLHDMDYVILEPMQCLEYASNTCEMALSCSTREVQVKLIKRAIWLLKQFGEE